MKSINKDNPAKKELEKLYEAGELNKHDVEKQARSKNSALHKYFEWDDKAGARKFRLMQAETLISEVRLEVTRSEVVVRVPQYVRDTTIPTNEAGYTDVRVVARRRPESVGLIRYELSQALGYVKRTLDILEMTRLDPTPVQKIVTEMESVIDSY